MPPSLRRIGLIASVALGAAAVVVGGLVAALHSPPGERMAWKMAAALLSGPATAIEVEGGAVEWPFTLTADQIRVRDGDGVWLVVRHPLLEWRPARLPRRVLEVERLAAEGVEVLRRPTGDGDGAGSPPNLERLPVGVRVEALMVPIVLRPPVVGEEVRLDLGGSLGVTRGGSEIDLRLDSDAGGQVRLAGIAGRDFADLRWYAHIRRLERWQGLAGFPLEGGLTAAGIVAGRFPHPVLSARIEMGRGRAGRLEWSGVAGEVEAVPDGPVWRLSLDGGVDNLARDGERALPRLDVSAAAELDPARGLARIGPARLSGMGVEVSGLGVIEDWGRGSALSLSVEAARLDTLPGAPGLRGAARAGVTLAGDLTAPRLKAVVRGHARELSTGIPVLDRLLGPAPTGTAVVAVDTCAMRAAPPCLRNGEGVRIALSADLRGRGGSVALRGQPGRLWASLAVSDLSALDPVLSGAAAGGGRVVGSSVWAAARSGEVRLAGLPPAHGVAVADFSVAGVPSGWVSAELQVGNRPLSGSARVAAGRVLRIDSLTLRSDAARVTGELAVAEAGVSGRLDGAFPDLGPWAALAGVEVSGRGEAHAVLSPAGSTVAITARDLAPRDPAHGGVSLSRASVRAEGAWNAFGFDVDAVGFNGQPGGLAAGGRARLGAGTGRVELERLRLAWRGEEVRLTAPTAVEWRPGSVRLAPAALSVRGGRLTVRAGLEGGRLEGLARLDGVPLALAELAVPGLDAAGRLGGTIRVGGALERPEAELDLTGEGVGLATATGAALGRMAASLAGHWRDGRAEGVLDLHGSQGLGGRGLALRAEGVFPLTPSGMPEDGPVSGRVTLTGEVGSLIAALPLGGHVLAGRVRADVAVAGTVGRPRLEGSAALRDGRYENVDQGTMVTALSASARMDAGTIRVEAAGLDGGTGSVRLEGSGEIGRAWAGDLTLTDFRALRRDDATATVSGRFRLAGEGVASRLSGSAAVRHAEIDLGRLRGGGPADLQVVEINRPGQEEAPQGSDGGDGDGDGGGAAMPPLALDLAVEVARTFVRGRGLDSEWRGHLRIAGTLDDPAVTGRLMPVRGDYDLLGRRFRLAEDSVVAFSGGTEPDLAVAATARAADVLARVSVTGPASSPEIDFTSDPTLPRDEIIARVLFGKGTGGLSAFQQVQLGRLAAGGLLGEGAGGLDPLSDLRGSLGLDVLDVGSGEGGQGGPTLNAGKYIGPDTFLRVEQGTTGLGRVTVERELGGGFSVETSVGQQSGGGAGITWRKDY